MKKVFNNYRGLPRSIYVLFCIQVINRFGDFVVPFLTLLMTERLGFSFAVTGIIVMIASIITIPASFLGGRYADQIGRKKVYLVGQALSASFILFCGFVKNPIVITVLIMISSFFNGFVRPALSAIVADVLPPDKRQSGSSLIYLGINLGVAIGPVVAGFLFNNFLQLFFIGDAVTSFIAVIIVFIFIKETNPIHIESETHNLNEAAADGNLLKVLLKRPEILAFLTVYVLYCFVYTQYKFSLPMTMNKLFLGNGPSQYGFLLSVNALTVIFLTIIILEITKKFRPLTNIILGGIFYTIGFGMIGLIHSFSLFILSTILWSIGEILIVTNFNVYLANNSPKNFRARINAVGNLSWSAGGALGTSIMGFYINGFGIDKVWPLVFVISCISVGLMLMLQLYNLKIKL
jgi:MFS family permease